jgi:hypothetical protein
MVYTGVCLCLETMLDFLSFTNVDPKALTWPFLLDVVNNPNVECNARFKQE